MDSDIKPDTSSSTVDTVHVVPPSEQKVDDTSTQVTQPLATDLLLAIATARRTENVDHPDSTTLAGVRSSPSKDSLLAITVQPVTVYDEQLHGGASAGQNQAQVVPPIVLPAASHKPVSLVQGLTSPTLAKLTSDFDCVVCFNYSATAIVDRPTKHCCKANVCEECMLSVICTNVDDGNVRIECPNCAKALIKDEVIQLIGSDRELRNKYDRFLVDATNDGSKKTCPRCCTITEHKLPRRFRLKEEDVKLRCAACDLEWCFKCHAPWHAGLTCKAFKEGDKQFHHWTKGTRVETGDANCRQCPTCRVYIQRNEGCDHMTCNRCDSEFCYKCGGLYVPLTNHRNSLSAFGCKYLYDGHPAERLAVRGGYLAAKAAALTGYPFLLVGGAALLLVGSVVIVPIYIGYRVHTYRKNTRKYRFNRR